MCILVARLIGPLIGHTDITMTHVRTQDLKPVHGAKTSNATHNGQSTIDLASETKPNIDEKQSDSQAPKTVAQARASGRVCCLFSLNDTHSVT